MRCFLDGELMHDCVDAALLPVAVAASRAKASGEIILKAVNYSAEPQEAQVKLAGVRRVEAEARWIVLSSTRPGDKNSLAQPTRVAPVERTLTLAAPSFPILLPPYSINVVRVKALE